MGLDIVIVVNSADDIDSYIGLKNTNWRKKKLEWKQI